MRLLTRSDVERALPMAYAIALVRDAFRALSEGKATAPLRTALPLPSHNGITLVMPGHVASTDALAVKVVSVRNRNPDRGLARINALVVLVDAATGVPRAVMDGRYLTALRTGAGSGVATDLLARPDAAVLAMIGAGAQAREQILAVATVRPIRRVLVYARGRKGVDDLIERMRARCGSAIAFTAAASAEEAVAGADVVCTATSSRTPVFDGAVLPPGVHINGVGSYRTDMCELDVTTLRRAELIVVDQRAAAMEEAGELIHAVADDVLGPDAIHAELGEIVAGTKPGRERTDQITLFKSVGNAVQDAVVAQAIVERAERDGLGTEWDADR